MIKIVCTSVCPYCDMAKNLITSLWFEYQEINVDNEPQKLREIVSITQMMTVPQIFVWDISKENLLWWYSDIKALHDEWKLISLLTKINN